MLRENTEKNSTYQKGWRKTKQNLFLLFCCIDLNFNFNLTTTFFLPVKGDITIPSLKKPPHKLQVPNDLKKGAYYYIFNVIKCLSYYKRNIKNYIFILLYHIILQFFCKMHIYIHYVYIHIEKFQLFCYLMTCWHRENIAISLAGINSSTKSIYSNVQS